jgi:hypothetical protein
MTSKLISVFEGVAEVEKKRTSVLECTKEKDSLKLRESVHISTSGADAFQRAVIAAAALPKVRFDNGHRVCVLDQQHFRTEDLKGTSEGHLHLRHEVHRAAFGIIGATVGGYVDGPDDLETAAAISSFALPCAMLGAGIEESRAIRRGAKSKSRADPAAFHRKFVVHRDPFADKQQQQRLLQGEILTAEDIFSDKASACLTSSFDTHEEQVEFKFRCGEYSGRGHCVVVEAENKYRVLTTQTLAALLKTETSLIMDNIKYSWCYVSDDATAAFQGESAADALAALTKLFGKASNAPTNVRSQPIPGTLYYMSYECKAMLEPIFVAGDAPTEGAADIFYTSSGLTLVPAGDMATADQREAHRAGLKLKKKTACFWRRPCEVHD